MLIDRAGERPCLLLDFLYLFDEEDPLSLQIIEKRPKGWSKRFFEMSLAGRRIESFHVTLRNGPLILRFKTAEGDQPISVELQPQRFFVRRRIDIDNRSPETVIPPFLNDPCQGISILLKKTDKIFTANLFTQPEEGKSILLNRLGGRTFCIRARIGETMTTSSSFMREKRHCTLSRMISGCGGISS